MIKNRRHEEESDYLENHYDRRGDYFEIVYANSKVLKDVCYQIRHEVYCLEHGKDFSNKEHINQKEKDKHEKHSRHYLLMYKPLGLFIGTGRVVLPDLEQAPHYGLPALLAPNSPLTSFKEIDFSQCAEVSRFAISEKRVKLIKKDIFEKMSLKEKSEAMFYRKRRRSDVASPLLHLMIGVLSIFRKNNLVFGCMLVDPVLFNKLKKNGILLYQIGDIIDYHGSRQAAIINILESFEYLKKENIKTYNLFKPHYFK